MLWRTGLRVNYEGPCWTEQALGVNNTTSLNVSKIGAMLAGSGWGNEIGGT